MSKYATSSCDFDLSFPGPGSVEEYNQKAGGDRCLADAVNNIILRSTLPQWQKKMADALESLTSVVRTVDQVATDKAKSRAKEGTTVSDIKERATRYIARASAEYLATAGDDAELRKSAQLELNTLAQTTADSMEVDPSPATRAAGINKAYLTKADEILLRDEDAIEETVAKLVAKVGDFVLDRDDNGTPDRDSLAQLVGAYIKSDI